jgi:hypothetical protein
MEVEGLSRGKEEGNMEGSPISKQTLKRNENWTSATLHQAMDAIRDHGIKVRTASHSFGIPATTLRNHLYGRSLSRQRWQQSVLKQDKEIKLVQYLFKMQDLGHPLIVGQLRLKVALATQTRDTPWSTIGVSGKSWLRHFRLRHPKLASRKIQGLEMGRARGLCPISAASLYSNLEELYTSFHYLPSHIWNCDESGVQAGRSGGATVLARTSSRSAHCIEPDQREHLSILSCINADGGCIPNFYILKGTYFRDDYVKRCEENTVMAMQPNAWMIRWLFESWIFHFIACLKRGPGIDQNNRHLFILDGHNSHVILEVVTIAMEAGMDIISLPSHTSHALQPLDVSCFKPFKTRVLFLASEYVSKQVRVVPSINRPTKVNPSIFCSLKKEPCSKLLLDKSRTPGL